VPLFSLPPPLPLFSASNSSLRQLLLMQNNFAFISVNLKDFFLTLL
jgi:hypothetical protein